MENDSTLLAAKHKSNVFELIAYFALFDLLFMPYMPLIMIPISSPIIIVALLLWGKFRKGRYFWLVICFIILALISSFISIFIVPPEYQMQNFKRVLQLFIVFSYYFYFRWVQDHINPNINYNRIIYAWLFYMLVLIVWFFIDPMSAYYIRDYIYTTSPPLIDYTIQVGRFCYLYTDPNTVGYLLLIVICFLMFCYQRVKHNQKIFLLIMIGLTLIATQSKGVMVSIFFIVMFELIYFLRLKGVNILVSIKHHLGKVILMGLCLFLLIYFSSAFYGTVADEVVNRSVERLQDFSYEGGRLSNYTYIYENGCKTGFVVGQGYTLLVDGDIFKPHSDHIRMICSYGLIAYLLILYFLFSKVFFRPSRFLIPAFMAFSVNSLIDETKLFSIVLIFLAISYAETSSNLNKA